MWVIAITVVILAVLAVLLHDRHGLDLRAREFDAAIAARDARRAHAR